MTPTLYHIRLTERANTHPFTDHMTPGAGYYTTDDGLAQWRNLESVFARHLIAESEPVTNDHRYVSTQTGRITRIAYHIPGTSMSETLLHTAAIRQLRLAMPRVTIHAFAIGSCKPLLEANPDCHPKTFALCYAPERIGYYDAWYIPPEVRHDPDPYQSLSWAIGEEIEVEAPQLLVTSDERREVRAMMSRALGDDPYTLVQLNRPTRERSPDRWAERLWAIRADNPNHRLVCIGNEWAVEEIRVDLEAAEISDAIPARTVPTDPDTVFVLKDGSGTRLSSKAIAVLAHGADEIVTPGGSFLDRVAAGLAREATPVPARKSEEVAT